MGRDELFLRVLDEDRRLLDECRECLVIAERRPRYSQGRIGQADVRELGNLLGIEVENVAGNSAVVAELEVVDHARRP